MIELVERVGSDIDITAYMVSPYTPPPPEPSMSLRRATACEREFEDLFRQSLWDRPVMSLVDWKNGFAELESKVTLDTISCLSEDGVESARTPDQIPKARYPCIRKPHLRRSTAESYRQAGYVNFITLEHQLEEAKVRLNLQQHQRRRSLTWKEEASKVAELSAILGRDRSHRVRKQHRKRAR